jgi:hypothetical protein
MDFMTQAHRPTTSARAVPEPTWKAGSFSKVLHTLKLAYTSHLKHFLNDQWDDSHAKSVRNLADVIKTKLRHHSDADAAQLGEGDLAAMLEHLQNEFRWMICTEVFETCAERARTQKAEAFAKAQEAQARLQQRRRDFDNNKPKRQKCWQKTDS